MVKRHTLILSLVHAVLLCIIAPCCTNAVELIQSITIKDNCITYKAASDIQNEYLREPFFVAYPKEVPIGKLHDTILTIPFITSIIPIVWLSGKTYTIPAMDEDLHHSLERIHKVFKIFYPSAAWSGDLIPATLVKNDHKNVVNNDNAIALLFSHGLDALYTALRHNEKHELLITIWGSDVHTGQTQLWSHVKKICQEYAQKKGHQHTWIQSNFMTFTAEQKFIHLCPDLKAWWGQTSQGLGYCGLTAPLLYTTKHTHLLIAATFTNSTPYPYGTHPLIDNNLRFCNIAVAYDGPASRNEKVRFIKDYCQQYNQPVPMLRVCWGNDPQGGNCMRCEKCWRTIVSLLCNNVDPQLYGFKCSYRQALALANAHIPQAKSQWGAHLWQWNDMQEALSQWFALHPEQADSQLHSLRALITARDFKLPEARMFNPTYITLLKELWQKSMSGILVENDLDQALLTLKHIP